MLVLLSCTPAAESPIRTEVSTDLMWMTVEPELITIQCRRGDEIQKAKITRDSFSAKRQGVTLTVLDILVGILSAFNPWEK